jgi:hypothetical protein
MLQLCPKEIVQAEEIMRVIEGKIALTQFLKSLVCNLKASIKHQMALLVGSPFGFVMRLNSMRMLEYVNECL